MSCQRIAHLGFLDDDVDRDVDARAGQMRGAAGLLKGLVGKVGGLAAGVEAAHATVDGVCPAASAAAKGSGPPAGAKSSGLRLVVRLAVAVISCLSKCSDNQKYSGAVAAGDARALSGIKSSAAWTGCFT